MVNSIDETLADYEMTVSETAKDFRFGVRFSFGAGLVAGTMAGYLGIKTDMLLATGAAAILPLPGLKKSFDKYCNWFTHPKISEHEGDERDYVIASIATAASHLLKSSSALGGYVIGENIGEAIRKNF